ncbi:MAG: LamG domain-containing protein [Myxococcales bacterium]|nr:LamG domain-containing protein [Myxococcales bacterium]
MRLLALALSVAVAACGGEEFSAVGTGGAGGSAAGSGGAGGSAGTGGGSGSGGAGGSAGAGGGAAGTGGGGAACRGLKFDGVDDVVRVKDAAALDGLGKITVEAWVFPESYPGEVHVLSHHDHNAMTGYALLMYGGSEMQFRYQFGGQMHGAGFTKVAAQEWHHVAATHDGSKVRLFVDGAQRHEQTLPAGVAADCAAPLSIGGAAYEDNFPFHGIIDEVRLSRVARYTAAFTPSKQPFLVDADTVALWHFDEVAGQAVTDAAGKHHGTLGKTTAVEGADPARVPVPCALGGG